MRKKRLLGCLVAIAAMVIAGFAATASADTAGGDWLLVPYGRAGVIDKSWSYDELRRHYGSDALTDGEVLIYGEQPHKVYPKTTVRQGTGEQIAIVWSDADRTNMGWVEVSMPPGGAASRWQLAEGYYAGMALKAMEGVAGHQIPFCGFFNGLAGIVPFAEYGGLYTMTSGVALQVVFTDKAAGRKLMGDRVRWSGSSEVAPYRDALVLGCIAVGMNRAPQLVRD